MAEYHESEYAKLPPDFPRAVSTGTVPGTQPKILVVQYKGIFYPAGATPPELYERWRDCEEIAQDLAFEAKRDKADNLTRRSESEMLQRYLHILSKSWMTLNEAKWIVRRMGEILNWSVPTSASA
jgi:hypothetical protein